MPTYIALLRGINVGGNNPVKMEPLHAAFAALGFDPVVTYLQSGNVVFGASRKRSSGSANASGAAPMQQAIERRVAEEFGASIPVLVLSQDELRRVATGNPFAAEPGIDLTKLHVTFLFRTPGAAGLAKLEGAAKGNDRYVQRGTIVYLHCPDGYGRSKLANAQLERMLSVQATTRNWNTVNELGRLASS